MRYKKLKKLIIRESIIVSEMENTNIYFFIDNLQNDSRNPSKNI